MFPGEAEGKPLQGIKRFWEDVRTKAKLPGVRSRDLRHTFASLLVSGGMTPPMIGKLLGHTQVQTTQRYAHLLDEPLRAGLEQGWFNKSAFDPELTTSSRFELAGRNQKRIHELVGPTFHPIDRRAGSTMAGAIEVRKVRSGNSGSFSQRPGAKFFKQNSGRPRRGSGDQGRRTR